MAKIKQASHPSLARPTTASSTSAPTPGTPGYASHRSHASSSSSHAAPVVLTRQERKALADAREFGLTPGAKAASTRTRGGWREGGPGKMTLEEEGISRLAKLTAERAGLVDVPPAARGNGNGKGKGREAESTRRTVSAPVNGKVRNGDRTSDRSGSSKIGGNSGEGSSRRPEPGPRVLTPRKPREMDRAGSPSSSRPTPRSASDPRSSRPIPRKRPRSPSPDTESSLDSDDLDRNERSKRRATGKGRDRDRDGGRGSSGRANGGGGGGILASLGFDAYQSFSRSGKDREQYVCAYEHGCLRTFCSCGNLRLTLLGTCEIPPFLMKTRMTWRPTRRQSRKKKLGPLDWPGNKTDWKRRWRESVRRRR